MNRKLNRIATLDNIIEKAGDNIKDLEKLRNADDEFLVEAAMLWEAEVVYE